MSKSESNANSSNNAKASINSSNLNLPALTKEISSQLTELGKISNNNHTQLEELESICKNLSKHLTSLATAITNTNNANEELSSISKDLCSTKDNFSTLKTNISNDISKLQAVTLQVEEKIILLTNLHASLSLLLRNEQNRFNLTEEDFTQLKDTTTKTYATLDKLSRDFPSSVEQNKKAIEEKLDSYTANFTSISKLVKSSKEQAQLNKDIFRTDSRVQYVLLILFIAFAIYCDLYYSKHLSEVQDSLSTLKEQIESIKPTPTPTPSPTITPKAEKKR